LAWIAIHPFILNTPFKKTGKCQQSYISIRVYLLTDVSFGYLLFHVD